MTPLTVQEIELHNAMVQIESVEDYEAVLQEAFGDGSYTLFKGSVLQTFTCALMRMKPDIAQGIGDAYHRFLFLNFDAQFVIGLLLE